MTTEVDHTAPTITLGGADIGRCLTRLHHDRFTEAVPVVDPVRERRAQAGFDHEDAVVARLIDLYGADAVVIGAADDDPYGRTHRALADTPALIIGGRIASPDGSLVGAPDLLVRLDDGYAAIEIKGHFVVGNGGPRCHVVPIEGLLDTDPRPPPTDDDPDQPSPRFRGFRKRDLYQVAHYWAILDATGFATPTAIGGVIGTEQPLSCAWVDLERDRDSIRSTADEFTAEALAALRAGASHPDRPAVAPYWRGECGGCPWRDLCLLELRDADDPTLIGDIGPELRASLALDGVTTVADIADLDLDTPLLPDSGTVAHARAMTSGQLLRRLPSGSPVDVPNPRREVDFDIETYGGRIYLAGFLETIDGVSQFDPIVDWECSASSEPDLIQRLFERLAVYAEDDTTVFHWTSYEPTCLRSASERLGLSIPGFADVDAWFAHHAVDLHRWTKDRFVSGSGYSLKAVAPMCGFAWRDDDPGGAQSELWFEAMQAGDLEMRPRLLAYNEDDVIAQLAIRRWVTGNDDGAGPGSAVPSVHDWPLPQDPRNGASTEFANEAHR